MVVIDRKKCIGCGLCAADCPAEKLTVTDGKAVYTPECIQCGHCVAVCPRAAVSIPEYDMADVEEYDRKTFTVDPENFLHAVKFRRSIRNYREKAISREVLERILEAGRYTATAKNRQACRFIVLQEELSAFREYLWGQLPELAEEMKKTAPHYSMMFKFMYRRRRKDPKDDPLFFNAPACIFIASDTLLDGGLAAANIENMAVAEGAGVLYSGYIQRITEGWKPLKEWLGIGDTPVACCMLIGYPAVAYKRTAPRKKADITWR